MLVSLKPKSIKLLWIFICFWWPSVMLVSSIFLCQGDRFLECLFPLPTLQKSGVSHSKRKVLKWLKTSTFNVLRLNGLEMVKTQTQWSWTGWNTDSMVLKCLAGIVYKSVGTYGLEMRTGWSCKGMFPMGNSSAYVRASSSLGLDHLL